MGRKATDDGGRATIDKLYPEANELRKKRLTEKLKTYSSNKAVFNKAGKKKDPYVVRAFPVEGLIRVEEGKTSLGDAYRMVSYPSKSHCYLLNLLDLDGLIGGVEETIDVLWNRDSDARERQRKDLSLRFKELKENGRQQVLYAENAEQLLGDILGSKDPLKDDLFLSVRKTRAIPPLAVKGADSSARRFSFIGLSPLERIERIGRSDKLTVTGKAAEKSVVYLEMGNTALALEFANKALSADPENGYAWMVKGYLALQGVKEAMLSCIVQQELGARENAITAEEQWRQQLLEENAQQGENNLKDSVESFLKAWCYWPKRASVYIFDHYEYKVRLALTFFKYAARASFDKELLRHALRECGPRDLDRLCLSNMSLFLNAILPVVHSVDKKQAIDLARRFVSSVRGEQTVIDDRIPREREANSLVLAAGQDLGHLHKLSLVLQFKEVESFMLETAQRFRTLKEVAELEGLSCFYINTALTLRADKAAECSRLALSNIPFASSPEVGVRLKRQWQYFYLRCVTQAAIESMLFKATGSSDKVAKLLVKALNPELLEQVAGKDHFITVEEEVEEEDDVNTIYRDLGGRMFHVLHDDVPAVLSEFITPFRAEEWFEALVAKWEPAYYGMCRRDLLLLYLDGLADGKVKPGYQDFLRSLGRNGRDIYDEVYAMGEPEFKALEGHTATSFVLAYALKAEGVKQDVAQKLEGLRAVCEKIATTASKKKRKIIK